MDAAVAKHQLDYIIKKSSKPISRLLDSALSNAHNNLGLVKENLFIKDIVVNEGPKLKRFRPKGFGMASPIEKKTSRIKIVLEERVPGLKAEKKAERLKIKESEVVSETHEVIEKKTIVKAQTAKPEVKKEIGKKGGIFGGMSGLGKRFFRRKAI
jgi:large subunit ribosomal protein L22